MKIKVSQEIAGEWKELTDFDGSKKDPIGTDKSTNFPTKGKKRTHGDIALQSHGNKDTTAFRNIRWRDMKNVKK